MRRSTLAPSRPLSVGLEGPQASLAVASGAHDPGAAGGSRGTSGTRQGEMAQRRQPRRSPHPPLGCVYAAGPGGSWRERARRQHGAVGGGGAPMRPCMHSASGACRRSVGGSGRPMSVDTVRGWRGLADARRCDSGAMMEGSAPHWEVVAGRREGRRLPDASRDWRRARGGHLAESIAHVRVCGGAG